jgi:hypothetical protein
MVPLHARSARLSSMRYYVRKRKRAEFQRARRVLSLVKANRVRIVAITGSIALVFIELGFLLGVLVTRWRG